MFYSDGFQRNIPTQNWGDASINGKKRTYSQAFEDSFQRPRNEYKPLQSRKDIIDSILDIPKNIQIDLSKASLARLLNVEVPNPMDTSWLQEKQRIIQKLKNQGKDKYYIEDFLKNNPPLGRRQFTMSEEKSLSSANIPLEKKMLELQQEIREGRASSDAERANIIVSLTNILNDTKNIDRLITRNMALLQQTLQNAPNTIDYKTFGMNYRFIDLEVIKRDSGKVSYLMLQECKTDDQYIYPVVRQSSIIDHTHYDRIKLSTLFGKKNTEPFFLDLFAQGPHKIVWRHRDFIRPIVRGLIGSGVNRLSVNDLFHPNLKVDLSQLN